MKLNCSTLVLDLDGTISDPSLGIARCFNHALHGHGLPPVPEDSIKNEIGPPLDQTFLKFAPEASPDDITSLIATYRERYSEVGYSENTLYPDVPAVLEQLKNSGLKLGVCTSKRRDFACRILSMFDLQDLFSFVDGGDIGITKGSQLAGLLRSRAIDKQAIMVGDRSVDVLAAKENSLHSIGVLWGFGDHKELAEASASCIIESAQELPNAVRVL